jgi:hypothetical protein
MNTKDLIFIKGESKEICIIIPIGKESQFLKCLENIVGNNYRKDPAGSGDIRSGYRALMSEQDLLVLKLAYKLEYISIYYKSDYLKEIYPNGYFIEWY